MNNNKEDALNEYLSKRRKKDKGDAFFRSICQIVATNLCVVICIYVLLFKSFEIEGLIITIFCALFALALVWAFYDTYIKKDANITKKENPPKTSSIHTTCRLCKQTLPLNEYGICDSCNNRISKKLEEKKSKGEIIECKICGKEIEYNEYGTCKGCQNKILKDLDKKEKIYCTNCGKEVNSTWKHCKYCGKEIL